MHNELTFGGTSMSETLSALFELKQVARNLTTAGEYKLDRLIGGAIYSLNLGSQE